jgi:hypothetical protein
MYRRSLVLATAISALTLIQPFSAAQELSNRVDRKITGDYFRPNTASSYHRGAISHAESLNYYGRRYSQVPAETTKEHTAEIRRNLNAAKKEFTKLGKETKGNKRVETHLKAIKEHQAKAEEMCDALDREATDGKTIAACCQDIAKELKAAEAENAKLKKALGVEEATDNEK